MYTRDNNTCEEFENVINGEHEKLKDWLEVF